MKHDIAERNVLGGAVHNSLTSYLLLFNQKR